MLVDTLLQFIILILIGANELLVHSIIRILLITWMVYNDFLKYMLGFFIAKI